MTGRDLTQLAERLAELQSSAVPLGFCWTPQGWLETSPKACCSLFPGAFAPLHAGHLAMCEHAHRKTGQRPAFEISVRNVDKPAPAAEAIAQRLLHFRPEHTVWLTNCASFEWKSRWFDHPQFVIGFDTLLRIANLRYYDSADHFLACCQRWCDRQVRFLVYGRMLSGTFHDTLDERIPESLARLCEFVPQAEFRQDISSTELRR